MGAKPMSLGLDLQGGVHFLMQVDEKAALDAAMGLHETSLGVVNQDTKLILGAADELAGQIHGDVALYETLVRESMRRIEEADEETRRGLVLTLLTGLKQICNHPAQALGDGSRIAGRSGKLARFDELVDEMIADARENGFRIVPECSYVVAAFARHPEWADLKAT